MGPGRPEVARLDQEEEDGLDQEGRAQKDVPRLRGTSRPQRKSSYRRRIATSRASPGARGQERDGRREIDGDVRRQRRHDYGRRRRCNDKPNDKKAKDKNRQQRQGEESED